MVQFEYEEKFYITAAIPYVNSLPHVGMRLSSCRLIQSPDITNFWARKFSYSGGDENALKNVQAAEKAGVHVQEFVDKNTEKFLDLTKKLNCEFDVWQKGSVAEKDTEVVVLRLTNSIGALVAPSVNRWTLLANDLCRQAALTGRGLVSQTHGCQWRDFVALRWAGSYVQQREGSGTRDL